MMPVFLAIYTERIGVELGKRGQQGDRDDVPWLLYHLMNIDLQPERIAGECAVNSVQAP